VSRKTAARDEVAAVCRRRSHTAWELLNVARVCGGTRLKSCCVDRGTNIVNKYSPVYRGGAGHGATGAVAPALLLHFNEHDPI
jgi:hypothetical protein